MSNVKMIECRMSNCLMFDIQNDPNVKLFDAEHSVECQNELIVKRRIV